jgi:hypothetical protein
MNSPGSTEAVQDEIRNVMLQLWWTKFSVKFRVFWDVVPCNQIEVDRRFRGVYCPYHQGNE